METKHDEFRYNDQVFFREPSDNEDDWLIYYEPTNKAHPPTKLIQETMFTSNKRGKRKKRKHKKKNI